MSRVDKITMDEIPLVKMRFRGDLPEKLTIAECFILLRNMIENIENPTYMVEVKDLCKRSNTKVLDLALIKHWQPMFYIRELRYHNFSISLNLVEKPFAKLTPEQLANLYGRKIADPEVEGVSFQSIGSISFLDTNILDNIYNKVSAIARLVKNDFVIRDKCREGNKDAVKTIITIQKVLNEFLGDFVCKLLLKGAEDARQYYGQGSIVNDKKMGYFIKSLQKMF